MSFTILSAVLLLVVGTAILIEVTRGYRRGFMRTTISLAVVVLSALVAAPLAVWLSDFVVKLCNGYLPRLLPIIRDLTDQYACLEELIPAVLDVVISPILFVVFFGILRLIGRIVVAAMFKGRLAARPNEIDDPMYESELAPWHRRHSRFLGSVMGGLCGFLVSLVVLSPTIGLLSVADTVLQTADRANVKWSAYKIDAEQMGYVIDLVDDPVVKFLEASGGGVIYDASACTRLNEYRVTLRQEVEICSGLIGDLMGSMKSFKDLSNITDQQKELLASLSGTIEESEVLRLVASDGLHMISNAWLNGNSFMGISCPSFNQHLMPLVSGILEVCADCTPDCVGRDVGTIVSIFLIASDSGLLSNPSYDQLAASLDEDGVIQRIYDEILANPCTAPLADRMTDVAVEMMSSAIDFSNFDQTQLDGLMTHLSDAVNRANGMGSTNEERVNHMKDATLYYAEMYGVNVPDSLAEMAAVALIDKLGNKGDRVTPDDLRELFKVYAGSQ